MGTVRHLCRRLWLRLGVLGGVTAALSGVTALAGAAAPGGTAAPAVAASAVAPAGAGRYRWPVDGIPTVVRGFDPPERPWLSGHRGVDLAVPPGQPVRAAAAGVVVFAGDVAGRPVVSIDHATGLRTTYEPVRAVVAAGDPVRAGDPLGTAIAGHPGCAVGGCLHWGLRRGAVYLDPLALLGLARVRLLPLADTVVASARPAGGTADRVAGPGGPPVRPFAQAERSTAGRRSARRSYWSVVL